GPSSSCPGRKAGAVNPAATDLQRRLALDDHVPIRPRIERAGSADGQDIRAVHEPNRRRAILALPQNVGVAVAVVVTGALYLPLRPGVERADGADKRGMRAVHEPNHRRAIFALPDDVGLAVTVKVAGALDLPIRPRVERTNGTDKRGIGAVHQPHRGGA